MYQLGPPQRHHVYTGPMNRMELIAALNSLGVRPDKLRGQNFLLDQGVLQDIVASAALPEGLPVVEIGPGLGALSCLLAERQSPLTLIEVEPAFAARLREVFAGQEHVQVIEADALDFDFAACCLERGWTEYAVMGNLPYSITTPLLKKLLAEGGPWRSLTLLLQKEAARRIAAGQGRENGPLTLLAQYYGEAQLGLIVPPGAFYPQPAVDSQLLCVNRRHQPPVEGEAEKLFRFIEAAFAHRRKQLVHELAAFSPGRDKDCWRENLAGLGLKPTARAEELTLADFAALYALIKED